MPDAPFIPPPIPVHLAEHPTIGGLVIPYTTLRHTNGNAALGLVDGERMEQCLRDRLCGVCARPLTGRMVFLMRAADLARKCSVEPAVCAPCAAYTRAACPMVGGHMARYRESIPTFVERLCGDPTCSCSLWKPPSQSSVRLGAPADRWYALWTLHYRLARDPEGRLVAGFSGLKILTIREITNSRAALDSPDDAD